MKFRVRVLPKAELQLCSSALWWSENRDPQQAANWLEGFEHAIATLDTDPARFALAPEKDEFPEEIRELLYGLGSRLTHRALFEVRDDEVLVHAIRHHAQPPVTPVDFD